MFSSDNPEFAEVYHELSHLKVDELLKQFSIHKINSLEFSKWCYDHDIAYFVYGTHMGHFLFRSCESKIKFILTYG